MRKYAESIDDDLVKVDSAHSGVDAKVFFDLVEWSGLDRGFLAEEVFGVSLKTMLRYNNSGKKLDAKQSEIALTMMALLNKGTEVFATVESFVAWLKKPAIGIANRIPLSLMNTHTGFDLIHEELLRIEYGALA